MADVMAVIGPPGTGKTQYLSDQIALAVDRYGQDRVLVSSLTRAAAHEIASRNQVLPDRQVGTLHAHCYRQLGVSEVADSPKGLGRWNEYAQAELKRPSWMRSTTASADGDDPYGDQPADTTGDRLAADIGVLRARMVPATLWPNHLAEFHNGWEQFKADTGAYDFTDLLDEALRSDAPAPGSPDVIIGDEAQDWSRLEMAVIRHWADQARVLVYAGDPEQCLYQWRGTDPEAFNSIPTDRARTLGQSYRLPRSVHAVADCWRRQLSTSAPAAFAPRDADGMVSYASHTWRYPETLLDEVESHIGAGETVMILTSASYLLEPVKAALRAEAIPFHNPYRRKRGDWNPLGGGGKNRRSAAQRLRSFIRTSDRLWTADELRDWTEILESSASLVHGAKATIKALPNDRPVTIETLRSIFNPEALTRALDADDRWYLDHILEKRRRPMEFPAAVYRKRGLAALSIEPKCVVGTVHSVKGGEAQHVYVFPDLSPAAADEWWGSASERDSVIRMFYVAMTRARESLTLCEANSGRAVDW